jgi:hypothetical protein
VFFGLIDLSRSSEKLQTVREGAAVLTDAGSPRF